MKLRLGVELGIDRLFQDWKIECDGLTLVCAGCEFLRGANMGRLDGRTALITGAGSGIGAACAELFSAEGASVFCADLDVAAAQDVADRVNGRGGSASAGSVDVT